MNRRKMIHAVVFAGVLSVTTLVFAVQTEKYDIDPVHSFSCFKIGHLGIGSVHGCFTDISGSVVVDKSKASNSSVNVVVNATSVNTFIAQRDDHLRSADFLDVAKYPKMEFKSTKVSGKKGGEYRVTGDFTLHGVTKRITVAAKMVGRGKDPAGGGTRGGFESAFTIRRSDYGMDKMIPGAGDKVEITLAYEGVMKK